MKHLSEGLLRAYYDGAPSDRERERVRTHLSVCVRCAQKAERVQARGLRLHGLLTGIDPQSVDVPVSSQAARYRLERDVAQRKEHSMRGIKVRNVLVRRYRPTWVAVALVLAFAVSFSFAPVRALAGDLLGLFRVRRIEFVEVNPVQLADKESLEDAMRRLESMLEGQVRIESDGEPQLVDEDAVRSLSVFRVRLPTSLGDAARIAVRPGMHANMQIDLPRIRALLSELGYQDIDLPESLDGAEIDVDVATAVIAAYGECATASDGRTTAQGSTDLSEGCTMLTQMPSPSVSAPPELDVDQLGRAYLQLLGMSAAEAEHLSQRVDWTTTLVLPIPQSINLDYQDVYVDGVVGTLIRPPQRSADGQEYLLMWVQGDIVYALAGSGTVEDALQVAESLQ